MILRLIASGLVAVGLGGVATAQTYHVHDLGTLGGLGDTEAFGLSRVGAAPVVAGYATRADRAQHGFVFDGSLRETIPLAPDTQSVVYGVDALGRGYGVMYILGELTTRAFRTGGAVPEGLGALTVRGVNDAGDAAGFVSVEETTGMAGGLRFDHACVLRPPAGGGAPTPTDLGTVGGSHWSRGYAINNAGVVGGCGGRADDTGSRALVWTPAGGGWTGLDLGTVGGAEAGAYAINDSGVVAGYSARGSSPEVRVAAAWTLGPAGQVLSRIDLGTLPPGAPGAGVWSYAYGINTRGVIVGQSNGRGFVFEAGRMKDLNALATPGWFVVAARAINDSDAIAAWGVTSAGEPRPLLLTRCDADFNRDGAAGLQDLFDFLAAYFAGSERADIDLSGSVGVQDVFSFLALYFAGPC